VIIVDAAEPVGYLEMRGRRL